METVPHVVLPARDQTLFLRHPQTVQVRESSIRDPEPPSQLHHHLLKRPHCHWQQHHSVTGNNITVSPATTSQCHRQQRQCHRQQHQCHWQHHSVTGNNTTVSLATSQCHWQQHHSVTSNNVSVTGNNMTESLATT